MVRTATALVFLAVLSGCAATGEQASRAPTVAPESASDRESVSKVLVFLVENHSYDEMRDEMPWVAALSDQYGYATGYRALTHPSLPNYLGIVGGSMFGVEDDHPPDRNPVSGESVFGQALALGKTARVYAEGMPENCALEDGGERYAIRHNPWAYFVDERDACLEHDVAMTALMDDVSSADLPNAGMVVPDTCHDGHDCGLDVVDSWMRDQVGLVMSGPDWASGRLVVVITADEDDDNADNLVLTTVAHPSLDAVVVDTPFDHYALTRLFDDVLGAAPLREAASAASLADEFGLPLAAR